MIPGVSAGSNQVGASVVCTPQVNCPCGPAAAANFGVPATIPKAASANRSRRVTPAALPPGDGAPRPPTGDAIALLHAAPCEALSSEYISHASTSRPIYAVRACRVGAQTRRRRGARTAAGLAEILLCRLD